MKTTEHGKHRKTRGMSEKKRSAPSLSTGKGKKAKKAEEESVPPSKENEDIVKILNELADIEKNKGERYKFNAYRKAAQTLSHHPTRIKSGSDAKKLPGIGEKIALKIDEIISTGTLEKLEKEKGTEENIALHTLTRVHGVGPAQAKKWFEAGIKTLDDLRAGKVTLNHQQQVGLKYCEDFEQKIPRSEMIELEELIKETALNLDPKLQCQICGSYRRGADVSGDIDVLVTHPSFTGEEEKSPLSRLVTALKKRKFLTDDLGLGEKKYMGVCILPDDKNSDARIHRRMDIRAIPYSQWGPALLYFTGSNVFNVEMRRVAIEKGYSLSEYGLFKTRAGKDGKEKEKEKEELVHAASEEDIFKALGMLFKEPSERN